LTNLNQMGIWSTKCGNRQQQTERHTDRGYAYIILNVDSVGKIRLTD